MRKTDTLSLKSVNMRTIDYPKARNRPQPAGSNRRVDLAVRPCGERTNLPWEHEKRTEQISEWVTRKKSGRASYPGGFPAHAKGAGGVIAVDPLVAQTPPRVCWTR